ncbi:MAG TPA: CHAT domain-containing tetratricopeptide repeat protein [Thermoanaerobaculia bacterium]|nr:CHAT domain-containing tetratricopeptide repeat protein [Thermoanaerobaculia bacterium]
MLAGASVAFQHQDLDETFFRVLADLQEKAEPGSQRALRLRRLEEDLSRIVGRPGSTPPEHPARSRATGVGEIPPKLTAIWRRLAGSGPEREQSLPRRVELCRQALSLFRREENPRLWAVLQIELGNCLAQMPRGRTGSLEQAITAYEQALRVWTREETPEQWAIAMYNLGAFYRDLKSGDPAENLDRSIAAMEHALEVWTQATVPQQWAQAFQMLGENLYDRRRGDRGENLERAIEAYGQALRVHTREAMPEEWARTQHGLATALRDRLRGDRAESVERAIQLYKELLEVYTRDARPVDWARVMSYLASAYRNRILGDRAENLEQAIEANLEVLQIQTRETMPSSWAVATMNLANAYSDRLRGMRADNIEVAIGLYEQVLEVYTLETAPVDWARAMTNLASSYVERIRGDRADNIERAIEGYRQVLQVYTRRAAPREWAGTMMNLGSTYARRLRGKPGENREQAVQAYRQALEVFTREVAPLDWASLMMNLGNVYTARAGEDPAAGYEPAIACFKGALEVWSPEAHPYHSREAAKWLGNCYFEQERWEEAADAYQLALQAAENLYRGSLFRIGKTLELATAAALYRLLAYALARTGRLREAVTSFERGRARGLGEALARDRASLERARAVDPEACDLYQTAVSRLLQAEVAERTGQARDPAGLGMTRESLLPHAEEMGIDPDEFFRTTATYVVTHFRQVEAAERAQGRPSVPGEPELTRGDLRRQVEQARADFAAAAARIQRIAGYEDFLAQPDFDDVAEAVQPGLPIVYLEVSSSGSLALVVHRAPGASEVLVEPVWADGFLERDLKGLFERSGGGDTASGFSPGQLQDPEQFATALPEILSVLGERFLGELALCLRGLEAKGVILVPGGRLGVFPLHAATYRVEGRDSCLLDELDVAYAPSARALTAIRRVQAKPARQRLVAVGNPRGSNLSPALFTDLLARDLQRTEPKGTLLLHAEATTEALWSILSSSPPVDLVLGCHGVFEPHEPLHSGLELADGRLTLARLLDGGPLLSTKLVVLSACESALSDSRFVADEAMGLPTGFLQAGAHAVLATLWPVHALPTVLLLRHLYSQIAQGVAPARALRHSIAWLRELPRSAFLAAAADLRRQADPLSALSLDALVARSYPGERPFSSPFFWAAFTYSGIFLPGGYWE